MEFSTFADPIPRKPVIEIDYIALLTHAAS
jgi:hypothetical protein